MLVAMLCPGGLIYRCARDGISSKSIDKGPTTLVRYSVGKGCKGLVEIKEVPN